MNLAVGADVNSFCNKMWKVEDRQHCDAETLLYWLQIMKFVLQKANKRSIYLLSISSNQACREP